MSKDVLKKSLNLILKNQFEYIIDHLDECVFFLNSELKVLSLNRKASSLFARSEEECLEQYCHHLMRGTDDPCDDCPAMLAIKDGQVHEAEQYLQDNRRCLVKSIPIFKESNELKGIIEIIRLLPEPQSAISKSVIKEAEDQRGEKPVHQQENVLKSLLDNLPVGVMTKEIDDKLKITLWNQKMADIYGFSKEQVIGKTDEQLFQKYNLDLSAGDESILNNRTDYKERTEIYKKGDYKKVLKTIKTPVIQDTGEISGILCIVEDETEKQRDQDKVREREARFRAIFNNVLLSIIILNPNGYVIYGNDHFYETFDIEENSEIDFSELLHPDFRKQHAEIVRKIFNNELRYYSSEFKFLLEPETTFWANVVTTPIKNNKGEISSLLIMAEDITEKKYMEAYIRQSEKMSSVGQLAHGIAHDFKNQLAGIMGYAQILNTKIQDEHLKRYIQKIIDTTNRATSLTQKLSDFARKEPKVNKPVKVNDIIDETMEMLKPSLNQSIEINVTLATENEYILGDPVSLQNALLNLCINAKDAMPDGGRLELNTEILNLKHSDCMNELHMLTPGEHVKISVTDNGIGMDEATKKKALEPFYTTKEKGKGTGLGLSSVFSTIEKHNGALTIWSAPNVGSSINIFLPTTKTKDQNANSAELEENAIEITNQGGTILYVEDEDDIREVTTELLKEGGYTVTAFSDPQKALSYYQKNWQAVDLVLLDVIMPDIKGDELFRYMKEINSDVKVILNSGYSDEARIRQAFKDGIKGFLQKPVQKTVLWHEIYKVLKT